MKGFSAYICIGKNTGKVLVENSKSAVRFNIGPISMGLLNLDLEIVVCDLVQQVQNLSNRNTAMKNDFRKIKEKLNEII
jgi:hypothetical protein